MTVRQPTTLKKKYERIQDFVFKNLKNNQTYPEFVRIKDWCPYPKNFGETPGAYKGFPSFVLYPRSDRISNSSSGASLQKQEHDVLWNIVIWTEAFQRENMVSWLQTAVERLWLFVLENRHLGMESDGLTPEVTIADIISVDIKHDAALGHDRVSIVMQTRFSIQYSGYTDASLLNDPTA